MAVIKKMSVAEFREIGGLQEINRLFLHPRGLALEVVVATSGDDGICITTGRVLDTLLEELEGLPQDKLTPTLLDAMSQARDALADAQPEVFGKVWDARDDDEGIYFGGDGPDASKAIKFRETTGFDRKMQHRHMRFGWGPSSIQPCVPIPPERQPPKDRG